MKKSMIALCTIMLSMVSLTAKASEKAKDLPECQSIVKSCEAAGFEPGEHKKNGKGLWVDCVKVIAKGKTVTGVTATEAEAKACQQAKKSIKKSK